MEDYISQERHDALVNMENVPNKEKRLVIFSDYGLDDACATVYLLQHRQEYDAIDIMPVAGNVLAPVAMKNARKLLAAAQADGLNLDGVRLVDSTDYYQNFHIFAAVHGKDGMGDLLDPVESASVPTIRYEKWRKEIGEGYRVLSLGPATMVRRTLSDAANIPGGRIFIMGGCVAQTPNFGKYEFNDGLDHFSFTWLLNRPHSAVTLDTCRIPAFNMAGKRKSGNRLLDILVNRSVELAEARHPSYSYIHDYIAAVAFLHPEYFEVKQRPLEKGYYVIEELHLKKEYRAEELL